MLIRLAEYLDRTPWARHVFFLSASLLTIVVIGYHFGTFDQVIHIPFLKIEADPGLFPNDPFFDMRFQHYSYFWMLFIPFYRTGMLESVMFVTHVLTTYLAFWGLWVLSKQLFSDPLAALLGTGILVMPHLSFAGFPLFEFSLLNRTFVFPFMVWVIILFLQGRYALSFLLLGLMYNLHVISVNFVLALLLFDCLLTWREVDWRKVLSGLALFVVAALPVLIWKSTGPPVDLTPRPEWLSMVARGILYNVFYMVGPMYIWLLTASGLGGLALFAIGYRYVPAQRQHRSALHFVMAVVLVLLVEVGTALWLPVTLLIQFQIIRIGFWGVLFGYLYFANFLALSYRQWTQARADWAVLAGATLASPLAFFPALLWAVQFRGRWHTHARRAVTGIAVLGMVLGCGAVIARYDVWEPGIHLYGPQTPWEDVQLWAKTHTARDAVFITPPQVWGFYQSEWRVFSERSTVSTLSELLEAAFVPTYVDYWRPRFESLAPGTVERLHGDFFADRAMVADAFCALSDAQLLDAARRYGVSYVVVEKPCARPWMLVYENADYLVYDVRP